jgi:hypothetical protein
MSAEIIATPIDADDIAQQPVVICVRSPSPEERAAREAEREAAAFAAACERGYAVATDPAADERLLTAIFAEWGDEFFDETAIVATALCRPNLRAALEAIDVKVVVRAGRHAGYRRRRPDLPKLCAWLAHIDGRDIGGLRLSRFVDRWGVERVAETDCRIVRGWRTRDSAPSLPETTPRSEGDGSTPLTLVDLAGKPIWVAWQEEPVEGKPPRKIPYAANGSGGHGSSTDPATWGTRVQAVARAAALPKPTGRGGVGVVLTDIGDGAHLCGIDLDSCRDPACGTIEPWAMEIVDRLATYTEVSPSRTGIKVFFAMTAASRAITVGEIRTTRSNAAADGMKWARAGDGPHPPAIELFLGKRYFTTTGELLAGAPAGLRIIAADDMSWLIHKAGPAFVGVEGEAIGGKPRDESRSAKAFRIGLAASAAGKNFDDFKIELGKDPATSDWLREKGLINGERELKRIWEKVSAIVDAAPADPKVAELNKVYALVLIGDKAAIIKIAPEGLSFLSLSAFRQWFGNRFVAHGKRRISLAEHWLSSPVRRQYEGLVFAPKREVQGHYNLWRGFAVEPKPGDCSLFLAHLRDNVCRGDEALFNWVLAWFADIVQHPDRKPGTSLAVRGKQGTGKSKIGEVIGSLLGSHYVSVSDPRYITGRFNSHLVSCLLLHADEAFWAGDHAAEGKLKDLVTGSSHLVELKGKEVFRVSNHVRLLVTGNPEWVVPAGMEERRFAVLDIGDGHKEDFPYFAAIDREMENGGRAALLYYLLNLDITDVNLRSIPRTSALLDQKLASLTPEQGWWLDILQAGQLPRGVGGGRCPKSAIFDSYTRHARDAGAKRRAIETRLGIFLERYAPGLRRERTDYVFPDLKSCRDTFGRRIEQNFAWSDPDAVWDPPIV